MEPRLEEAKNGERVVLFVDAAHFIFATLLGCLWSKTRTFIKSHAGRKRYNVLGALNAVSKKVTIYTNESYINSKSVCKLLKMLYLEYYGKPITIILDNAKYQRCNLVQRYARLLKIELLFLPSYSPNLNTIERFWKYVKKKVLYSVFHKTFEDFKESINKCIIMANKDDKKTLDSLLSMKFQSFEKVKILTV